MQRISFKFSVEKFADAMALLAERVPDLTSLKAAKLLYLADRAHLLRHARPILGDWYAAMDNGPVPANSYALLKEVRDPDPSYRSKRLDPVLRQITAVAGGKYPQFKRRQTGPLTALSLSEFEALEEVIQEHGKKSVDDLVDLTHEHIAWQKSYYAGQHVIEYRAFFEDAPESQHIRELMEAEQEDREFIDQFSHEQ